MYNFQQAKGIIEDIHLEYLSKKFALTRNKKYPGIELNGFYPDLFGVENDGSTPKSMFEMKSRTYTHKQNPIKRYKPQKDFEWWELTSKQIMDYENISKQNNLDLFWIFVLGHSEKRLSRTKRICEDTVLEREIHVTPWDAYKLVSTTITGKRHLRLPKITKKYNFNKHDIDKGTLWIAEEIAQDVNEYFFPQL